MTCRTLEEYYHVDGHTFEKQYKDGDTRKELLIRSRYLLYKSADKCTERQKQRAAILFKEYPDIKTAYGLCHSLRMIFSKNTIKDAARLSMARWYNKVEESDCILSTLSPPRSMNTITRF